MACFQKPIVKYHVFPYELGWSLAIGVLGTKMCKQIIFVCTLVVTF